MSLFSKKQVFNLEDFCRDFYDNQILNPTIGDIDFSNVFPAHVKKTISEADNVFDNIDSQKLRDEIIILRFELFALAWAHKFISGNIVVSQSAFTKHYLHEKGRSDIWDGMMHYNEFIDSATLHWLKNLGNMNLSFNYNMRKDLAVKNIESAKELGVNIDESIEMVNNRLWSENAWKQKIILEALILALCDRLDLNPKDLNKDAGFRLAVFIRGLYEGAQQSWENVKIK
ncbi:MAG: hypothetical protein M1391_16090 [Bacteroidetes bacterium]|nr:hypothetical protein [Bacteroidota bacterium]